MTLNEQIMKLQTYKMFEGEDTVYVERDDVLKLLEQEPCEDCISRQAVLSMQYRIDDSATLSSRDVVNVDDIEDLPPVIPQPKIGRWISFGTQGEIDGQIVRAFTCSKCGAISIFRMSNENIVNGGSCPDCGAKMEETDSEVRR